MYFTKWPNIVLADDDRDLIRALSIRCSALGLRVYAAHDATAAWEQIESIRPEVVVLDVEMPAGCGLDICERMANHDVLKQTPVILLTGRTDHQTVQRCHELMVYYVPKCDDFWSRLKPLICEILEKHQPTILEPEFKFHGPHCENSKLAKMMDAVFASLEEEFAAEEVDLFTKDDSVTPWVLCIDDDEAFAHGLKLRLQEQGVEFLRASAGMEGYRRAFMTPADLILLDYEMPDGNGDYVLRRLKENPVTKDIPVIVLTGRRERTLERKMYTMGASSYMTKPYNWPMLWSEINKHLPVHEGH